MESIGRAERIAEKLKRGLLLRAKLIKTWEGFGNGRPCDGCDEAILSADIEHELDFEDDRTLRFHDATRSCDGGKPAPGTLSRK